MGYVVERVSKKTFDDVAVRAGISSAVLFELVIDHLELTDQGIPTWMNPLDRDGELPIDSA